MLEIPANQILELFGRMFFDFCQESGYDKILQVLGATPRDFLQNLDALHDHLATIYPGKCILITFVLSRYYCFFLARYESAKFSMHRKT